MVGVSSFIRRCHVGDSLAQEFGTKSDDGLTRRPEV